NLSSQQLRTTQDRSQRIIEIMGHTRSELSERAQLIGARSAFTFFLLLGNIARNAKHTRGSTFNDERRVVHPCISQLTIMSEIAHLVGLRQSRQSCIELFSH